MATSTESQEMLDNLAVPGYEDLAGVFREAYRQAAVGKGAERHAGKGEAFADQVMQDGAKRFGVGALLFQAYKKSEESQRLPLDRATNELLGAMVYLAGAVIARRRAEAAGRPAAAFLNESAPPVAPVADPIGATLDLSEGWHTHNGRARPLHLGAGQRVELEFDGGLRNTAVAGLVEWDNRLRGNSSNILRWRKL